MASNDTMAIIDKMRSVLVVVEECLSHGVLVNTAEFMSRVSVSDLCCSLMLLDHFSPYHRNQGVDDKSAAVQGLDANSMQLCLFPKTLRAQPLNAAVLQAYDRENEFVNLFLNLSEALADGQLDHFQSAEAEVSKMLEEEDHILAVEFAMMMHAWTTDSARAQEQKKLKQQERDRSTLSADTTTIGRTELARQRAASSDERVAAKLQHETTRLRTNCSTLLSRVSVVQEKMPLNSSSNSDNKSLDINKHDDCGIVSNDDFVVGHPPSYGPFYLDWSREDVDTSVEVGTNWPLTVINAPCSLNFTKKPVARDSGARPEGLLGQAMRKAGNASGAEHVDEENSCQKL